MKSLLSVAMLSVALVGNALGQEPAKEQPKVKIAIVNLNRINNGGINYEKIRFLGLDKATLEALKKINSEIQDLQKQVVDANDETTLQEISRRMQFLNQKSSLLKQRVFNEPNRDIQSALRTFVVNTFKNKYPLILQQQDSGNIDRILWKGDIEVVDITEEVQEKFREFLDQLPGGTVNSGYRYHPSHSSKVLPTIIPAAKVAKPVATPAPAAPVAESPLPQVAK